MAISTTFTTEEGILIVTASGFDESLQEVIDYNEKIAAEAFRTSTRLILCDERELEYRLDTLSTFDLAEHAAIFAADLDRAAIVCKEEFLEDASFWETVAANRGLNVKVFPDLEPAKTWLRSR